MEPRAQTYLRLLKHESMMIWLLADLTGVPPATIENDLRYLEGFGMAAEGQRYWVRPTKSGDNDGEQVRGVG